MDKGREPVKIGIAVDNDIADAIDQIALKVRRAIREGRLPPRGRGRSIGAGTVAAEIVERVVRDHPELLKEFFVDDSSLPAVVRASLPSAAPSSDVGDKEYVARPKERSLRQAKK